MTAVAGDFYDFLELDATRLGILIADVSGHGVPAALIASMVKVALAAQRDHADQSRGGSRRDERCAVWTAGRPVRDGGISVHRYRSRD